MSHTMATRIAEHTQQRRHRRGCWSPQQDAESIATLRALSLDQVQEAGVGHLGIALGMAPVVHTLFSRYITADPKHPGWVNRDRFVLSAGHGSALLYAQLHLAGFRVTTDDLRRFRQLHSNTPGHPEFGVTEGVDATTGPLGQGVANAVGMAIAETMGAARLNTDQATVVAHRTWAIASDGDLMEGVANEAIALAGVLKLHKLTLLYDDNDVVIDGPASETFDAGGTCSAIAALGWQVSNPVDAEDLPGLRTAIDAAIADTSRPSLIRVRSIIGHGSSLAGLPTIHSGAVSPTEEALIRSGLGSAHSQRFAVPPLVAEAWNSFPAAGREGYEDWYRAVSLLQNTNPEKAADLESWLAHAESAIPVDRLALEHPNEDESVRQSSGAILDTVGRAAANLVGGAADLASSTFASVPGGIYSASNRAGRNIRFGIREHAMSAISNGIAQHGLFRPFASTFAMFASYEANALRMAALQNLPVIHILSHDSITVGEDGPTHQPIEVLSMLRATPNTTVLRPADAAEARAAWQIALSRLNGPTILAVSRGPVPQLDRSTAWGDPARGGYILQPAEGSADIALVASGSEVAITVAAAALLSRKGIRAEIVSLISHEVFQHQEAAYRDRVLKPDTPRLVIEASHPLSLHAFTGPLGAVYGIDTFGASAPPDALLSEYGFTPEAIAAASARHLDEIMATR